MRAGCRSGNRDVGEPYLLVGSQMISAIRGSSDYIRDRPRDLKGLNLENTERTPSNLVRAKLILDLQTTFIDRTQKSVSDLQISSHSTSPPQILLQTIPPSVLPSTC
jgi:hypothetical protein